MAGEDLLWTSHTEENFYTAKGLEDSHKVTEKVSLNIEIQKFCDGKVSWNIWILKLKALSSGLTLQSGPISGNFQLGTSNQSVFA